MDSNHQHHFCEHQRCTGKAEGEYQELKVRVAYLEPEATPVGLQDRDMEIGILLVQSNYPVSWIQDRENLGMVNILNLSFMKK